MFDFDFERFVSTALVRGLYGVFAVVMALVACVSMFLPAVNPEVPWTVAVVGPVAALFTLFVARIGAEGWIVLFRVAEHLQDLVKKNREGLMAEDLSELVELNRAILNHLATPAATPPRVEAPAVPPEGVKVCPSCGMAGAVRPDGTCPQCGATVA